MAITSRNELIEYCLRKLGHPVLEINVDVDQIEDRIDDALEYYQDYHFDATEHQFYIHQITQAELDQGYIQIPDSLIFVKQMLALSTMSGFHPMNDPLASWDFSVNNPFNTAFNTNGSINFTTNDQAGMSGTLTDFFITMTSLETMQQVLGSNSDVPIRFSRHTNKIHFDSEVGNRVNDGDYVVFEGWAIIDPEEYTKIYNDRWLRRYATALIKQQWGANLIKYSGIALPGGVTLDGDKLYDQANTEIQALEDEMQLKYELPVDFMSG